MLLLNSVSIPRATFYHHKRLNRTRARNRSLARLKSSAQTSLIHEQIERNDGYVIWFKKAVNSSKDICKTTKEQKPKGKIDWPFYRGLPLLTATLLSFLVLSIFITGF